jgi:glycosyl transferase family 2
MAIGPGRAPVPILILLPTLNEEKGLEATLRDIPFGDLRALGFEPRVLVVDGHSTDATVVVAHSLGAMVITQTGKGKGAAVREGMDWAAARGFPHVIVADADFTYPGSALPAMATLLEAGSDLVIGIRRPDRHAMSNPRGLVHRLGNACLNFLAGYLSRGPVLDICSGLWGIHSSAVPQLDLVSEGFDIEAEAFVKAFRRGMAISQVPVVYRDRIGEAKLHAFQDGARILFSILRYSGRSARVVDRTAAQSDSPTDVLPAATVRDLQSVLLALNSNQVFVSAAAGGGPVVGELVRRLSGASPSVAVEQIRGEPVRWRKGELGLRGSVGSPTEANEPWTIVIDLPSRPLGRAGQKATIQVPSGQRTIHIDLVAGYDTEPVWLQGVARSRAYKLERSSERRLGSLRILSSSLAQFGEQRDLALIAANVANSEYSVFRERERKSTPEANVLSAVSRPSEGRQ